MVATSLYGSVLALGTLRRVHHFALNVKDMQVSRHFYGTVLGLRELTGDNVPATLKELVEVLHQNGVDIDHGPVNRPTGRGIYFYDPDGFLLEIRCDPD